MNEDNLEFQQLSEDEEEKLDFANQIPCPHCKKSIPCNSTMCLYCGEAVASCKKSSWVVLTAVILIVIFIVFALVYL